MNDKTWELHCWRGRGQNCVSISFVDGAVLYWQKERVIGAITKCKEPRLWMPYLLWRPHLLSCLLPNWHFIIQLARQVVPYLAPQNPPNGDFQVRLLQLTHFCLGHGSLNMPGKLLGDQKLLLIRFGCSCTPNVIVLDLETAVTAEHKHIHSDTVVCVDTYTVHALSIALPTEYQIQFKVTFLS